MKSPGKMEIRTPRWHFSDNINQDLARVGATGKDAQHRAKWRRMVSAPAALWSSVAETDKHAD